MAISSDDVRRIAELAHLELEDVERYRRQLQSILDHVALLEELDVDAVRPLSPSHTPGRPLRQDRLEDSLPVEQALDGAPDAAEGHFRVPRILEG